MACSGGYCANQCYVNVCNTYGAPNAVWNYTLVGEASEPTPPKPCPSHVYTSYPYACSGNSESLPSGNDDIIYDTNMFSLAESINDERARRSIGDFSFDTVNDGDIVYGNNATQEMMKDIKTAINGISSGYVTYTIVDGNSVPYSSVNEARTKIDALRASCLCNADCGGHLVCACYNDCGCNYSDERLKKDIRSL